MDFDEVYMSMIVQLLSVKCALPVALLLVSIFVVSCGTNPELWQRERMFRFPFITFICLFLIFLHYLSHLAPFSSWFFPYPLNSAWSMTLLVSTFHSPLNPPSDLDWRRERGICLFVT